MQANRLSVAHLFEDEDGKGRSSLDRQEFEAMALSKLGLDLESEQFDQLFQVFQVLYMYIF